MIDSEGKCFYASMALFFVPVVHFIVWMISRDCGAIEIGPVAFFYLLVGGLLSNDISKLAARWLEKTNRHGELSDWLKAFGFSLLVIVTGAAILAILALIVGIFVEFWEFLKWKYPSFLSHA